VRAQDTVYELQGRKETAPLTPLALLRLLPAERRPERVVAVVTASAKQKTWPLFRQAVAEILGAEPDEPVEIPDGRTPEELRDILHRVAERFPPGCQLTLDVTQGLRHFPFVVYALALYLTSLRGVRLRGAYYGMLEGFERDDPTPRPIVDLRLLLELPEWFHAVRVFRDQGIVAPIARLIRPAIDRLRRVAREQNNDRVLHRQASELEKAAAALERQSFAYGAGLPLELGKVARAVADTIPRVARSEPGRDLPLIASLADIVAESAEATAFGQPPPSKGVWKAAIALDEQELERQARLIDAYLDRGQVSLAVGLMREWVISWVMRRSGQTSDWLGYSARKPFERRLGALGAFIRDASFGIEPTPAQNAFGEFWNRLADELRNSLMHHGMRPASMEQSPESLQSVRDFWNQLRAGEVDLPELGGGAGRLLISPQGNRPGVFFSALRTAQAAGQPPQRCIVICSKQSAETVPEAARHAGYDGPCELLVLGDPFGGFAEIEPFVDRARRWLLEADTVLANLTGGTTLMGIVVQRLVEAAGKLDRPVRRFALIDRRPPADQDAEPYVQSEHFWLDAQPAGQTPAPSTGEP